VRLFGRCRSTTTYASRSWEQRNPERALLGWLEKCERGDWAGCDAAAKIDHLDQQELAKVYVEAVAWTELALHSAG